MKKIVKILGIIVSIGIFAPTQAYFKEIAALLAVSTTASLAQSLISGESEKMSILSAKTGEKIGEMEGSSVTKILLAGMMSLTGYILFKGIKDSTKQFDTTNSVISITPVDLNPFSYIPKMYNWIKN